MAAVELLLAAGANPRVASTDGGTATDFARRRGMIQVAARLDAAAKAND